MLADGAPSVDVMAPCTALPSLRGYLPWRLALLLLRGPPDGSNCLAATIRQDSTNSTPLELGPPHSNRRSFAPN